MTRMTDGRFRSYNRGLGTGFVARIEIEIALRGRVLFEEFLGASQFRGRRLQFRLCRSQFAFRLWQCVLIRPLVDLKQQVASLHLGTKFKSNVATQSIRNDRLTARRRHARPETRVPAACG